jgi:hypothetical protein
MPRTFLNRCAAFLVWMIMTGLTCAQTKPRARDLGVPFDGVPGPLNAITDVKGVEVGHTTIIPNRVVRNCKEVSCDPPVSS